MRRRARHQRATDYLAAWAELLELDAYTLAIGYTDTGPTLDLSCRGHAGVVTRWLLDPADTGGHR